VPPNRTMSDWKKSGWQIPGEYPACRPYGVKEAALTIAAVAGWICQHYCGRRRGTRVSQHNRLHRRGLQKTADELTGRIVADTGMKAACNVPAMQQLCGIYQAK
jgi:hypothetical protein